MKEIWILGGHIIPSEVTALAVFIGRPTKETLLNTGRFNSEEEKDHRLIDILLEYGVCGAISKDYVYEYLLCHPAENGMLNMWEYMFSGVTDMDTEGKLTVNYIKP